MVATTERAESLPLPIDGSSVEALRKGLDR